MKPGETPVQARERLIREASATLIAIADDYGESLVDVIAEVVRYIMEKTKVGAPPDEPVPEGRRGYKIVDGRMKQHKMSATNWRVLVDQAEKTPYEGHPVTDVQWRGREERFQLTATSHGGIHLNGIVDTRTKVPTIKWEVSR